MPTQNTFFFLFTVDHVLISHGIVVSNVDLLFEHWLNLSWISYSLLLTKNRLSKILAEFRIPGFPAYWFKSLVVSSHGLRVFSPVLSLNFCFEAFCIRAKSKINIVNDLFPVINNNEHYTAFFPLSNWGNFKGLVIFKTDSCNVLIRSLPNVIVP